MKRILLTTYPGAYLYHGGGEREIFLLRDSLNQAGFIADLYGPDARPIHEYEAIIHFSLIGGVESLLDQLRVEKRLMILWPNLWFVNEPSVAEIKGLQALVDRFQVIIFKSKSEERHFKKHFDISTKKIVQIKPGISAAFAHAQKTSLFSEVYGISDYVFWPGIIEPQKNQLAAVKALSELDIPVVISGDVRDSEYFELCKNNASSNFIFLPEMPFASEIYLSALANSKVFLELPLDFPGISALEAGLLGCNLVLSDCEWSREYFEGRARLVELDSPEDIRNAVLACLAEETKTQVQDADYGKYMLPMAYAGLYEYLSGDELTE